MAAARCGYSGAMNNDEKPGPVSQAQVLTLRGSDAHAFALMQLASKVDGLENNHWQWTTWLDATGKVRFVGMLWLADEAVHILLRGGDADQMAVAMQPYVMRAKVKLEAGSELQLVPAGPLPDRQLVRDDGQTTFGFGDYSLRLQATQDTVGKGSWESATREAISSGHPWLPDEALDSLLPPALGLYGLGAVVLGKGCYPGQEMVNRLHTRGGHKFGMAHVETQNKWSPGKKLVHDGHNAGIVLQCAGSNALLVVRHDALDTLPNTSVQRKFPA